MSTGTPSNKALAEVFFEYFRNDFGLEDDEVTLQKFTRLAERMLESGSKRDQNRLQKLGLIVGWVAHKIDVLLEENELPESYFNVNAFRSNQGYSDPNEVVVKFYEALRGFRVDLLSNSAARKGYKLCRRTVHEGVVKH